MPMTARSFLAPICAVAAMAFVAPVRGAPAAHAAPAVAFTHVTVVDVESGGELPDRTVVIADGRIAAIGAAGAVTTPAGARVIDAHGKYLIPGLWDMHVHVAFGDWVPADPLVNLAPFVANGVTGVREMGGNLDVLLDWRRRIAAGELLGPRMVIAGPMLDGPVPRFPSSAPVANAADGRRVVDELKARGVDFIKIQSFIPRDGYFAAAAEARRLGITFVGHVPDAIRASEASDAGQKSIEHYTGIFEGCSTIEDKLIKGPKTLGEVVRTYDPQRAQRLVALMARNHTWQVPTLVWERGQWLIDAIDLSADPLTRYAPAAWRERTWPMFKESILKDMDTDPLPVRQHYVQMELDMTRQMFHAGVPFLAGTDTAAGVHIFPGFSLHQELELFVQAGLSPLDALRTATLNPARFLGREAELGSVTTGKIADLVLLDKDPLSDIHNARRIAAVVLAGRYLPRAELDGLLAKVERAAKVSK